MDYATYLKNKLFSHIEEMNSLRWLFVKNPTKDFSRIKKWSFSEIIKFMISMEGKSLRDELCEYFEYDFETPSNSSFNQRRAQILPEAFEFLFKEFTSSLTNNPKTHKGYRLIACDGSDFCYSNDSADVSSYIHPQNNAKGYNLLHLNALYDLLERTYVDAIIQGKRQANERRAMCDMVDRLKSDKTTIFIADRGFENYNLFAHVEKREMYYLVRVRDVDSSGILSGLKLPKEDCFDIQVSYTLTTKQTNEVKENKEKFKFVPHTSTFDYLTDECKFYDISFRIARFPLSEDSFECVITNLPANEFDSAELKDLYRMRWGIETSFRELKYAIGLTHFHAKKTEYIKQEIWARLILYNFCEAITTHVVIKQKSTRKYNYQVNYTRAIRICCYFLRIKKARSDIEKLIGHELLPVRPDRKDPRKVKIRSIVSFLYRVA